ncbi:anti-sigma factor family protein [Cellulomonas fengjieae]|uniref:Zf-HC2 domain-containing protein n=1 Tax=Cellulomonas fengjieae TaxID=2819978 RepID=A0ABS3SIR2_9CELL|nr:zf-HC2 domain-containing protein [Cellulomonas fengjieae]MBO3085644.1 zf-HC2 domain-containing protein [Cellulomonas fengjieae]MBO3102753.1 zf-HC2 domain-containing protein [Cellulomonas fengjieae]QVI67641.1 zf-HC2 domain-containing protein [Cellulomonas fengjieae]
MTGRDEDEPTVSSDDAFRDWDAAYVLGSLGPADRRAFEEHLRTCAPCRAAVGELAGLPGLLRLVPAEEAATLGGPAADVVELASVARAAQRVRRRGRVRLVGAAAALLLLGGVAGVQLGRPAGTTAPVASPSATAAVRALELEPVGAVAVSADLTLQEKGWGTRIDWECSYPEKAWADGTGPVYELVLVEEDGTTTVVATWLARNVGARGLGASSSITTDMIRRVEIRVEGADAPLAAAHT